MNLNRTKNELDREARNLENENWKRIEEGVEKQKMRVDRLLNESEQPSEVVDARGEFDTLGNRLDAIDDEIGNINDAIDDVNSELDNINSEIDSINSEIDGINSEISNINNQIDDIDSQLTQIAQTSEIVESGENQNGHYVKWANGLMICFGQTVATNVTSDIQMQYGGYRSTAIPIAFAATFDASGGAPAVSVSTSNPDVNGKANYTSVGYSSVNFVVYTINKVTTPIPELRMAYFAIGRWKGYD